MSTRPKHSKIAFVDLDAFFAAVEQRDDPGLPDCVLVGTARGPVLSASYAARACRVRPRMPMPAALARCPQAVRRNPNRALYRRVANQVRGLCAEYTDLIQPAAPGQFYLDITYNKPDLPFAKRLAQLLKADIRREVGLSASIGVGPNKFVARLAAHAKRPDGLLAITPQEAAAFVAPLPLGQLPGAGRTTRGKLKAVGIETVGQLAALSHDRVQALVGVRGLPLWDLVQGRQDDPVLPPKPPKIEAEQVYRASEYDADELLTALRQVAEQLAARLRRHRLQGQRLLLEVRYGNGQTAKRTHDFGKRTDRVAALAQAAEALLRQTRYERRGVRRLGLSLAGFEEAPVDQLDLFGA